MLHRTRLRKGSGSGSAIAPGPGVGLQVHCLGPRSLHTAPPDSSLYPISPSRSRPQEEGTPDQLPNHFSPALGPCSQSSPGPCSGTGPGPWSLLLDWGGISLSWTVLCLHLFRVSPSEVSPHHLRYQPHKQTGTQWLLDVTAWSPPQLTFTASPEQRFNQPVLLCSSTPVLTPGTPKGLPSPESCSGCS